MRLQYLNKVTQLRFRLHPPPLLHCTRGTSGKIIIIIVSRFSFKELRAAYKVILTTALWSRLGWKTLAGPRTSSELQGWEGTWSWVSQFVDHHSEHYSTLAFSLGKMYSKVPLIYISPWVWRFQIISFCFGSGRNEVEHGLIIISEFCTAHCSNKRGTESKKAAIVMSLHKSMMRRHLRYCIQFWSIHLK